MQKKKKGEKIAIKSRRAALVLSIVKSVFIKRTYTFCCSKRYWYIYCYKAIGQAYTRIIKSSCFSRHYYSRSSISPPTPEKKKKKRRLYRLINRALQNHPTKTHIERFTRHPSMVHEAIFRKEKTALLSAKNKFTC